MSINIFLGFINLFELFEMAGMSEQDQKYFYILVILNYFSCKYIIVIDYMYIDEVYYDFIWCITFRKYDSQNFEKFK